MKYLSKTITAVFIIIIILTTGSFAQLSFTDSGQSFGSNYKMGIAFGDVNGDGFIDAIVTFVADTLEVWMNDKQGHLIDIGYRLFSAGTGNATGAAMGDLDGDGDLDAFIIYADDDGTGRSNEVWINDRKGNFTNSGQKLGKRCSQSVALADLDNDGDLDAFVSNHRNSGNTISTGSQVWLNDGTGKFTDSEQNLGTLNQNHYRVEVGDLDGDGDIDVLVTSGGNETTSKNEIWMNNGNGRFTGRVLSTDNSQDVKFGDVDYDGDLDIIIAFETGSAKMYLNDGKGNFTYSNQNFGNASSSGIALGDMDNDGDLDAMIKSNITSKLWINNGTGVFSESVINLTNGTTGGSFKVLDINNDGHLDVLAESKIYFNNDILSTNNAPSAPTGLIADILSDTSIVLRWNPASDDHTTSQSLNYNLFVIKYGDTIYTMPPSADTVTGLRAIIERGTSQDTFCILKNFKCVLYQWGVQAIDGGYKSGSFAKSTFTISPSGINENDVQLPENIFLYQNYPNPFNPSTNIRYTLSKPSQVILSVYNLLGQKIKTLVDSFQSMGIHTITWNATDNSNNPVSSGVYFYSLTSKEINIQKKMMLLK